MQNSSMEGAVRRFATENPVSVLFFISVGVLTVLSFALNLVTTVLKTFIFGGGSIKKYAEKGSWAVITGATDGIGLEFSRQLAKAGVNVLLVSRNPEKLGKVAAEIESKYGVKTKYQPLDFSAPTPKSYEELRLTVSTLPISVLVNNVGKSNEFPTVFVDSPMQEIEDIVAINITATLKVTQLVLPEMLKRSKKSLILNIGSFSGMIPTPLLATYSASKAFLSHFTRALHSELKHTKVDVKLLNTYYVVSAMSKIRRSSMMIPSPANYVRSALVSLDAGDGVVGAPYWSHRLLEYGVVSILGPTNSWLVEHAKGINESIRKRALKRRAKETGRIE